MKLVILYRPNSEHARLTETFIHDYRATHVSSSMEIVDIDTRDGIAMAELYDVVQYPAIMALKDDGKMQKIWQGPELPLMDEVASYAGN